MGQQFDHNAHFAQLHNLFEERRSDAQQHMQFEDSLRMAQAREAIARALQLETNTRSLPELNQANIDKTRAETDEAGARKGMLGAEGDYNRVHAHMLTAQMLQQTYPDQPNIARDYITNAAETDPTLSAAKPVLHKMLEVPNAVNRIRAGTPQTGDEDLVGSVSPITLATARAEGQKRQKTTTSNSTNNAPFVTPDGYLSKALSNPTQTPVGNLTDFGPALGRLLNNIIPNAIRPSIYRSP